MFTIGEFSKRTHLSARMLRHYDAIGLLCPAQTGAENGYRYYEAAQLEDAARIETFKSYGFSLAEIAALLPLSQEETARRIQARRVSACRELEEARRIIRRMENAILQRKGIETMMEQYPVIVMHCPAQKVFSIRRVISIGQTHTLFQELYKEMERRGLKRSGATQLRFLGDEYNDEAMDVEAQAVVDTDGPGICTLPACTCAAVTHTGPYETIRFAYDAICAWVAKHPEYRVCGPAIERYLRDEASVRSPEELETGVLFPIQHLREAKKGGMMEPQG